NQKIARVNIFNDVEEGEKEKLGMSYFTIDIDLPIQSELVFDIEVDTNENLLISAYPKEHKNLTKQLIIGRGEKDNKAFETIEECTNEITNSINSWKAQSKYFELLKEMVKVAEEIGQENPMDKRWAEVDFKIKNAYDEAIKEDNEVQEGNRDDKIIFAASVIIQEYGSIMHPEDVRLLIELIQKAEDSEALEKQHILERIEKTLDRYIDLFSLFKLKAAADEAVNGPGDGTIGETDAEQDAKLLKSNHDQILSYFQTGKRDEGYALLNDTLPIAKKYY
nr:hypothetical protein [Bacteroidota bacterium]